MSMGDSLPFAAGVTTARVPGVPSTLACACVCCVVAPDHSVRLAEVARLGRVLPGAPASRRFARLRRPRRVRRAHSRNSSRARSLRGVRRASARAVGSEEPRAGRTDPAFGAPARCCRRRSRVGARRAARRGAREGESARNASRSKMRPRGLRTCLDAVFSVEIHAGGSEVPVSVQTLTEQGLNRECRARHRPRRLRRRLAGVSERLSTPDRQRWPMSESRVFRRLQGL